MNHRLLVLCFVSVCYLSLTTSCSDTAEYIAQIDRLLADCEKVDKELSDINPKAAELLYEQSGETKKRFKETVKNDTLELGFAKKLDLFLLANKRLRNFTGKQQHCLEGCRAAQTRLLKLKKDMEAGAGERARYQEFLRTETQEVKEIKSDCSTIAENYYMSKEAIEQFQPEIERFIEQFVSP